MISEVQKNLALVYLDTISEYGLSALPPSQSVFLSGSPVLRAPGVDRAMAAPVGALEYNFMNSQSTAS